MAITAFLSNTEILVVKGSGTAKSVNVEKVYSMAMPEGCMLNGIITDPQELTDTIKAFWNGHKLPVKGISLIINTSQIKVRVVDIPLMSVSKSRNYISRDISDDDADNRVMGFYRMSKDAKKKTSKMCAETADVDFISGYIQVFEEAGISLKYINSGIGVAVNLFHSLSLAEDRNYIVMIQDGMSITSAYFVEGNYFYSMTTRVFNNPGTESYGREVAQIVSQIEQFAKTQNIEEAISVIYMAGIPDNDVYLCAEAIRMTIAGNVQIQKLGGLKGVRLGTVSRPIDTMLYPMAGLMSLTDHVNILEAVGKGGAEAVEARKAKKRKIMLVLPYAAAFLIMTVITIAVFVDKHGREKYLDELNAYNSDPENTMDAAEYDQMTSAAEVLSSHYGGLKLLTLFQDSYPLPNDTIPKILKKEAADLGDVSVGGYDAGRGAFDMRAEFEDVESINVYVERLLKNPAFKSVDYNGYSKNENDEGWTAMISCILAETAGKEEQ